MAQIEVRWTATFDLDGRPPKGYFTFSPVLLPGQGDRVPIINGQMRCVLATGEYEVREAISGRPVRVYTLVVPASAPAGIDLEGLVPGGPGEAVTLISRQEFDALVADVAGLSLTTKPVEPVYVRTVAAASWSVPHSLGRYPEVTVLDDSGSVVLADVEHPSTSLVVISFGTPQTGKAVLT